MLQLGRRNTREGSVRSHRVDAILLGRLGPVHWSKSLYGALMQVEMSNREAALVLAALRNWQEEAQTTNLEDLFEAYFENEDPLEHEQIDALCQRIVAAATAK